MATGETAGGSRHLDLGCGSLPRNPYGRAILHGIDLRASAPGDPHEVRTANLATEPIPYPDGMFDSLSAYDFFEHVPRVLPTPDGRGTRFPFVELMDECWRVLRPGGLLYASTPCYPAPEAFLDPTHVNIVTEATHTYFTGPQPLGRMYGFRGEFSIVRVVRYSPRRDYEPVVQGWRDRLRAWNRARKQRDTHVLWELAAVKREA